MGIAALIIGILGILGSAVPFLGIFLGIAAIILGLIGRKQLKTQGRGTGAAVGGIITGFIALIAGTAMTVSCLVCGAIVDAAGQDQAISEFGAALDQAALVAPQQEVQNTPSPSAGNQVMNCNLSNNPGGNCNEFRITGGTTPESARTVCSTSQMMTPEAQRVPLADGPCPTENALARCDLPYGNLSEIYYDNEGAGANSQQRISDLQSGCTGGTFVRLNQ